MRTHALCTLPTDPKVDPAVAAAQLAVMHGRVKKDVVEPTPEEKAKQREQVRTARSLFAKLLALRQSQTYGAEALEMTSKALQFHPEFPTLWGYRRELLTTSEKPLQELLKMEMKLLEKALRKSQKVYSIWFHRKWVVERLFKELEKEEEAIRNLLNNELDLCNQLLAVDERNFHCWNHRMYLMDLMRTWGKDKSNPIDLNAIDLKLSTDLINQNFSNYSAWHLRTLLQQPRGEEPEMKLDVEEELEWVQQGIYTEPNDQSVWLYHQWLTLEGSQVIEITHCAVMDGELFIFFFATSLCIFSLCWHCHRFFRSHTPQKCLETNSWLWQTTQLGSGMALHPWGPGQFLKWRESHCYTAQLWDRFSSVVCFQWSTLGFGQWDVIHWSEISGVPKWDFEGRVASNWWATRNWAGLSMGFVSSSATTTCLFTPNRRSDSNRQPGKDECSWSLATKFLCWLESKCPVATSLNGMECPSFKRIEVSWIGSETYRPNNGSHCVWCPHFEAWGEWTTRVWSVAWAVELKWAVRLEEPNSRRCGWSLRFEATEKGGFKL